MVPVRILYLLLIAFATLLMSLRPPSQQSVRTEALDYSTEMQAEAGQGGEENSGTAQQNSLEELHDLQCLWTKYRMLFGLQVTRVQHGQYVLLRLLIPLLCCFQPPEPV